MYSKSYFNQSEFVQRMRKFTDWPLDMYHSAGHVSPCIVWTLYRITETKIIAIDCYRCLQCGDICSNGRTLLHKCIAIILHGCYCISVLWFLHLWKKSFWKRSSQFSSSRWSHISWSGVTKTQSQLNMSLVTRKPVSGVSDQVRLKPACSATETS